MKPYTYYLLHIPTGKKYYGVRYAKGCHPDDLWQTYFSSSTTVANLITEHGADSFHYEVRKVFCCSHSAKAWEHKVLRRLRVVERDEWLNKTDHLMFDGMKGKKHSAATRAKMAAKAALRTHSEETLMKMSATRKGKKKSAEHRQKLSEAQRGKKLSAEAKAKIGAVHKGKKQTPEQIAKRVAATRATKLITPR